MKRLALCLAVLFGGAPAMAADYAAPISYDWTGWYVGGFIGGASGHMTDGTTGQLFSGLDAGVHLLYNAQLANNWVISPFVAIPIPGKTDTPGGFPGLTAKLDWAATAGVRIGYALDRWLPYAFAGGAIGGVSVDGGGGSNTHTGITLGAGFDYALSDQWTVGLRYAHVSVGSQSYFSVPVGWNGDSLAATFSFKLH
jgi:outer membrane immunogenic protein